MESPTTILGLFLALGTLLVLFLRGVITRHFNEFDEQKKESAGLRVRLDAVEARSAKRDDELREMRTQRADDLARIDRETKAREQAEAARHRAEEERDTLKLEKQQLDTQYKREQAAMKAQHQADMEALTRRVTGLEQDRASDNERFTEREEAHRRENEARDQREAILVAERDQAIEDRDSALRRVGELEHEVRDLKRQVEELTNELRDLKAKTDRSPATPDPEIDL